MTTATDVEVVDLATTPLRELNQRLHDAAATGGPSGWRILNPNGTHAIAVGVDAPFEIEIAGHAGYYAAGMNKHADITITGNVGVGCAENIMSGRVHITGNASQACAATGRGGLVIVDGDAASRCGISMKGVEIVVKGDIGHMSAFMAQSGALVVLGDAGDALGDSIYETHIYVRGSVQGLGADCIEKELKEFHRTELQRLLDAAGADASVDDFKRYGSARTLYTFNIDHAGAY
jgi:glutamate synthase domain-containing protein 3